MARRTTRLVWLTTAGLLGGVIAASPTAARPTWQPVTNLFADISKAGGSSMTPDVAVDGAGDATALWARYDGQQFVVQTSTRPAGGTWSAPVDLGAGPTVLNPQLAVDAAGNATAVWRSSTQSSSVVQAVTRPAGGAWSAPVDLSVDGSRTLSDRPEAPQVAVDADGTATAVWSHDPGSHTYVVQAATREPGGTWSAPVDVSAPGRSARTPQVAVASDGDATAVWAVTGTSGVVQSATRPDGGAWAAPVDLSAPSVRVSNPALAVDATGTATAVWNRLDGSYVTEAATRPADGAWTAAVRLSAPGQDTFDTPQVAAGGNGRTTVVWQHHDGTGWIVAATTRTGDTWGAPADLSASGQDAWDPKVAVDPAGNATAVWSREDGAHRIVQAARGATGSDWSDPIDLSEAGQDAWNAQVAVDPAGNATTEWSRFDGANWIIQARGLDAAGPVVTALTSGGTAARRTYAVTAHDVWSQVASARWRFADGTTATGTSVTHSGSATGPVRVVLTDRVGNATTCRYDGAYTCRSTTRVAPLIHRARLSTHAIRAVGSDARVARKAKATITLNTDARVTFTFRKPGSKPLRLVERLDSGRNVVAIRARLAARKVLTPGRWTVVVTARNEYGTSPKERVRLRVVR